MASVLLSTHRHVASSPACYCSSHHSSSRPPRGVLARSPPITTSVAGLVPLRSTSSSGRSSPLIRRRGRGRGTGSLCPVVSVVAPSSSPTTTPASDQEGQREEGGGGAEEEAPAPLSASDSSSSFSSEGESFSWRDHWYPVSLVEDLDPAVPTPFQLLNRDIVLWRDPATAEWVAFDDRCPHRLAPLSEGRIDEDGWLQCSYHGWSFDGTGSCKKIPQAAPEGPEARAVCSPRACVAKFPSMVSQGLLFVWPDEKGWEKAAATKPPTLPDVFNNPSFSTVTIQRDLFYGYDTLMENVSDPSHIEFAHHKVTGRRDRAKPMPFKMESSGAWGFSASDSGNPRISSKFIAPCYNMNKYAYVGSEFQ